MTFRELPRKLQVYIIAQAVPLVPLLLLLSLWPVSPNPWLTAALLLATAVFATWKVELNVITGKMTLGFAVVCLALLLQGAPVAVACAALGALVGAGARPVPNSWKVRLVPVRFYKLWFNLASCATTCAASSLLFIQVHTLPLEASQRGVLAILCFTLSYFVLNTVSIALAIALQENLRWSAVWKENFLWTAPGFFASASAAAAIQVAFKLLNAWALLLLAPLYLVYCSYRLYLDKIRKDMDHIIELNNLNQAVIRSLATAIDAKDRYTCSHINRVQQYATALGQAAGLSEPEMQAVITGALVHDIGKLGVPDHILGKPGKLTAEEYKRIQAHVVIGAEILAPVPFPFPVVDVVLSHHERWDGLGYPQGLKGEAIPVGGRIISIVDVFDALTSDRPYRRALDFPSAIRVLREGAGKQFDPRLVEQFIEVLPAAREKIQAMEAADQARQAKTAVDAEAPSALDYIGEAAAEMAAVSDVAQVLAVETSEEHAVQVVVNRALGMLPVDTAILYLRSPDGASLRAEAVAGQHADRLLHMTIQTGEGVSGAVADTQRPLANVSAAPDVARRFSPEENIELSAATAVPLVHGPEQLGVLTVYSQAYGTFSAPHLRVLNILAEHAAATLHQIRRLQQDREMANTDSLTGLANGRSLMRHLEALLASEDGQTAAEFGVVMLDLDEFKQVNDQAGHLRGDELLWTVAQILRQTARPSDIVCRYAGDEFVVLLAHTGPEAGREMLRRLRQAVDGLPAVEGTLRVGASAGLACYPRDGKTVRELLHAADQQMYEDKFQRRQVSQRPHAVKPASQPVTGYH